jgi:hypothetical protein
MAGSILYSYLSSFPYVYHSMAYLHYESAYIILLYDGRPCALPSFPAVTFPHSQAPQGNC